MNELKVGMKVRVNKNMDILEEYQKRYVGLEGRICNIWSTDNFSYSVKFKGCALKHQILDFNAHELDIIKNNIRKI